MRQLLEIGRAGLVCSTAPLLALALAGDRVAGAAPQAGQSVATLTRADLSGLPGKEALLLSVEYSPAGASLPHRHDAEVFVYVLEGQVVMQVAGQKRQTLSAGATFHEGPGDVHLVSANASTGAPAKLLVFMVKDKDKPVSRLVAGADAQGEVR